MVTESKHATGKTKDAGWQVGARRSMPLALDDAWQLITSASGLAIWLGADSGLELAQDATFRLPDGTHGEVRVFKPGSHVRLTWQPPGWEVASRIQVRVIANKSKTTIAFHHEMLPGPTEREQRKAFFSDALDRLEKLVSTQ